MGIRARGQLPPDQSLDSCDITDPVLYASGDPHRVFAHLRERRPIECRVRDDGRRFWVLTRHADVSRVLRDPASFSTEYGLTLDTIRDGCVDPAANKLLEMCEGARHRQLRRQLTPAYTSGALAPVAGRLRRHAGAVIDAAIGRGTFDLATDIADPLASAVLFDLLGLPEEDWDLLCELNKRSEDMDRAITVPAPFRTGADKANHDLLRYLLRVLGRGAGEPRDGQLRTLRQCTVDGSPLTREELALNALGVMHAGHGTLRHAASGGVLALIEHPEERERVRRNPAMLGTLCDEVVRWTSPVRHVARLAVRDVEVRDATIRAGDIVTVWIHSANRDAAVFAQPDRFNAGRTPNRHLGYAVGPHVCLGANLARIHLSVLLGELIRRAPTLRLAGAVQRLRSNVMSGITSLPVTTEA